MSEGVCRLSIQSGDDGRTMTFYVAKGLQLAGLLGMPLALYVGVSHEAGMLRELSLAMLAALVFYAGRLLEGR